MIEELVELAIGELRRGVPEATVSGKYGQHNYQVALQRFQNQPKMTAQQFYAKQNAEAREFFRMSITKTHRVSQRDHDTIVASILDSINAGVKPAVRGILNAYASQEGRVPEWTERIAGHKHLGKMSKTLAAHKNHPVFVDLKSGGMLSQTHKSALRNTTYSGLAELLFSWVRSIRGQQSMQERIAILAAELAKSQADIASANARLKLKDQGQDWKEAAYSIRLADPGISNRELARRVGKSEAAIRNYL